MNASRALGLLVAGAAFAACSGARAPAVGAALVMPGPGPRARAGAAAANAACERCHAEAAASWRTSLHSQSWTNPVFQRSFTAEPSAFCRDCHAPESTAQAIGVGCVTCHDPAGTGEVLAAPSTTTSTSTSTTHALRRERGFAGSAACAGCHDFAFPDIAQRGADGARMQRTIEEHRASRFANVSCASCHMPALPNGARGHGFQVASDPMILKRAVVARASRDGERVVVDLRPGEVGHAFPTGDLFRRLLVVAEVTGEDYQLIAHAERPLARHFRSEAATNGATNGARVQREIGDDRVAQPQRVDLVLGPQAREHPIAWRVEWQRVQSMQGDQAVIAESVIVAEGILPWRRSPVDPH